MYCLIAYIASWEFFVGNWSSEVLAAYLFYYQIKSDLRYPTAPLEESVNKLCQAFNGRIRYNNTSKEAIFEMRDESRQWPLDSAPRTSGPKIGGWPLEEWNSVLDWIRMLNALLMAIAVHKQRKRGPQLLLRISWHLTFYGVSFILPRRPPVCNRPLCYDIYSEFSSPPDIKTKYLPTSIRAGFT